MNVEELVNALLRVEWLSDNVLLCISELKSDHLCTMRVCMVTMEVDPVVHGNFLLSLPDCAQTTQ